MLLIVKYHKHRFQDDFEGGTELHELIINFISSNCSDKTFNKQLLSILGSLNVSTQQLIL